MADPSDGHAVHLNSVREQDLQRIAVAGVAAVFAAIADDENNFPPGAVAFAQIQRRGHEGIIQHVGFFGRSDDPGRALIDRARR